VEAAGGEWIAFLDADDAWVPRRLETQMDILAQHPDADLVCGGVLPVGSGEDAPSRPAARAIGRREFVFENPVATSTVLIRRAALLRAGGFDTRFRGPEDYDLWMRVAAGGALVHAGVPLARYRSVPGSLSMDDRRFLPEVLRVLEKAYAAGGALEPYRPLRGASMATQYWNASWMAFQRGRRFTALRHLARAWWLNATGGHAVRRAWLPLAWRYAAGRAGRR
jgi:hypothetical protein